MSQVSQPNPESNRSARRAAASNCPIERRTLTVREFMATYGVSRNLIYKLAKANRLRLLKAGRRTLIPVSEGERLLAEGL